MLSAMAKTGLVISMALTINTYHGTYNRTKRSSLSAIQNFVVHYTGGTGSAKNNCIYFSGGNRKASADFFIDPDGSIWEYNNILDGYYTWGCGDGGGRYGITNANSVQVEVVNNGGAFTEAQIKSLAELYAHVCNVLGRKLTIVRHYDASRKQCPYYYVDGSRWDALKARIAGGSASGVTSTPATAPAASKPTSASSGDGKTGTGFGGRYRCYVNGLRIRTSPAIRNDNIVSNAEYNKGDEVNLDDWYKIADGWVWGRYTGASSGQKRYVAVGKPTGGVAPDDYLKKV